MFRFRGFKASLDFITGKNSGTNHYDTTSSVSIVGAYRTNKDELFERDLRLVPPTHKRPSTVKLPTKPAVTSINQSRSTNDLAEPSKEAIINIRKSTPNIPQSVNQPTIANVKEQKALEKQRLAEEKKQQKLAQKERQREEKLRKEREKHIALQTRSVERLKKEETKKQKKRTAPQPQPQTAQTTDAPSNSRQRQQHSTNTLESTISKTSGPPPYSSAPEIEPNQNDSTGNTSFAKPVEDVDSWGLISQHRQQMKKQTGVGKSIPKQTVLDLHYNVDNTKSKEQNVSG